MSAPAGPIGVFDSGVGGLSVLRALRAELPGEDFVYIADSAFAPYGERGDGYVVGRARVLADSLVREHGAKALVVACNTATAAAIHLLREERPALPLVGVEPALKPAAALTRTGRVAVMATRGTLASAKFHTLLDSLTPQAEFILLPCDGLADAIEHGDATKTEALCAQYMRSAGRFGSQPGEMDVLVLGCTHYPFAFPVLRSLAGEAVHIVETGEPVARQTRRLLEASGLLNHQLSGGTRIAATGDARALHQAAARWLALS